MYGSLAAKATGGNVNYGALPDTPMTVAMSRLAVDLIQGESRTRVR